MCLGIVLELMEACFRRNRVFINVSLRKRVDQSFISGLLLRRLACPTVCQNNVNMQGNIVHLFSHQNLQVVVPNYKCQALLLQGAPGLNPREYIISGNCCILCTVESFQTSNCGYIIFIVITRTKMTEEAYTSP